jgi:hypothetical protein
MDAVAGLLEVSLSAWHVEGRVQRTGDRLTIVTEVAVIAIVRAPSGTPFRWMLTQAGRERVVTSVTGLLRLVRRVVQPDYESYPVRIAPLPVLPQ